MRSTLPVCLVFLSACGSVDGDPGDNGITTRELGSPSNAIGSCGTATLAYGANPELCLDVGYGGQLVTQPCSGAGSQQWALEGGKLRNGGGQCVTVDGAGWGAPAHLGACEWSTNWAASGNTFVIAGSNLCLDVQWGMTVPGVIVQQWECNGTGAQGWNASCVGGDQNTGPTPTSGITRQGIIHDMVTRVYPGDIYEPSPTKVGDGRSTTTQCLPRADAIAFWARQSPGSQWRSHLPWAAAVLGPGHVDNGSWLIEMADFDFQVFRHSAGWTRPAEYPMRPDGLVIYDLNNGVHLPNPAVNGMKAIYDMPTFWDFGSQNNILHASVGNGYLDPGDGSDVFSVFVSMRARFVPSGNGGFDTSGTNVYVQMGSDVYQGNGDWSWSNGHMAAPKHLSNEWQYFTLALFRDPNNQVDVHPPSNPNACDGMPTQAWFESNLPIGVAW